MNPVTDEYSLLKSLGNFYKGLPKSLISPSQFELLEKAADFFPPIIRFALECRLNAHEQVDLQFCLRRDEDDLRAISNWFQNKTTEDQDHKKVIRFLTSWADDSSIFHKNIPEIFLELDVLPSGIKTPLLFFELQPDLSKEKRKDISFTILNEIVGENHSFYHLLETIIEACPRPAFIAYLGILFSRDVEVLRVNIKKLPITAVAPFLRKIGYASAGPELDHWISFVYNYADRVTLCIDIGKDVFPKIGFECFWNERPSKEPYWRDFVKKLNQHNLYKEEKIEAILNWDQDIFPEHMDDWPEHLWIESLLKPENEFTFLKKWISHLKVTYNPGREIDLKAYLGYESLWTTKNTLSFNSLKEEQGVLNTTLNIKQAITKGVDYLLTSQQQSGWWKDFKLEPGTSDEWVTAYVGYHLSQLNNPKTNKALDRAWKMLKPRYRENEGWGYNVLTPADADSTIWAWLFFNSNAFDDKFPEPGFNMTDRYVNTEGGIITYSLKGPLGKKNQDTTNPIFNGWQIPHYCVTSAYALAGRVDAINFLLEHQNSAGFWYSYWWAGPEYATALSVEALFNKDAEKYQKSISLSVSWACDRAQQELDSTVPNDFKIALLLKIILCSDSKKKHHNLLTMMSKFLLNSQQSCGYWNHSAELRQPNSDNTDHERGENILVVKDENKNFTTVTVIDALNKFDQSISF